MVDTDGKPIWVDDWVSYITEYIYKKRQEYLEGRLDQDPYHKYSREHWERDAIVKEVNGGEVQLICCPVRARNPASDDTPLEKYVDLSVRQPELLKRISDHKQVS